MTDDIINSAIFYFFCGTMDVLVTILVVMGNIGVEGNPVWNWITPKELMLVVCVMANLCLCACIVSAAKRISRYPVWSIAIQWGLYGEGIGRLVLGVVPGVLIMKGAGWF